MLVNIRTFFSIIYKILILLYKILKLFQIKNMQKLEITSFFYFSAHTFFYLVFKTIFCFVKLYKMFENNFTDASLIHNTVSCSIYKKKCLINFFTYNYCLFLINVI